MHGFGTIAPLRGLGGVLQLKFLAPSIKIAQQPCIIGSLGPKKALKYEPFEGQG